MHEARNGLLEVLLYKQPVQDNQMLLKTTEICRLYDLESISSSIMKIAGVYHWKHGRKGSGVFWLQQARDEFRLNRIAQQLFDFVGRSISDESFKQWEGLIELLGSESKIAGGLDFLHKYRDFKNLFSRFKLERQLMLLSKLLNPYIGRKRRKGARERQVPDGHEGDEEGEGFVGVRSRAKKGGFGVESKWFDVEVREQKGKEQVLIVERKGGISSWVRLGPNSIGSFIDGLEACIGNAGTGIWEKQWKDSGRSFLWCVAKTRGVVIRLGVTDMGNKRFSIFIPKGNGSKNGWVLMAGLLRRLGCLRQGNEATSKRCDAPEVIDGETLRGSSGVF
ncbi:Nuclear pore complex protein NUP85 [Vitis vinifera]|uniref:Nuclear pore complex protein Nup85 n=1 Tax=Vitis vinifera TaxID=29760 RepID=A0A438C250_VITVI|nr:Nuclear pore complex protein NUP85 [Vitis vinifera]